MFRCLGSVTNGAVDQRFMQVDDLLAFKGLVADAQHGAAKAYRGGMLHGEGNGFGRGAEVPAALGEGSLAVRAQKEFARGVEDFGIHRKLSAGIRPAGWRISARVRR